MEAHERWLSDHGWRQLSATTWSRCYDVEFIRMKLAGGLWRAEVADRGMGAEGETPQSALRTLRGLLRLLARAAAVSADQITRELGD